MVRTNYSPIFDRAATAGKVQSQYKQYYSGRFVALLEELRKLELLLAIGITPTEAEERAWLEFVTSIRTTLGDMRKGRTGPQTLSNKTDELRALTIRLKEERLDVLINDFEQAKEKVLRLQASVEAAANKAERAAERSVEERDESKAAAEQQASLLKRLNRLEENAGRRRDRVAAAERDATTRLDRLKELQAQADSANRSVQAIQKQLDALANTITAHVQSMRDTESRVETTVAENNQQKDQFLEELGQIRKKADEALLRATAGSLYGVYATRQSEVATKVKHRVTTLVWASVGAFVAGVTVWWLASQFGWGIWEQALAKIGLATPIVFLLWFLTYHYNRERLLEEEYAHKASMSASYPAFREEMLTLAGDDPDLKQSAVHLSLDLTREIFRDPLEAFKSDQKPDKVKRRRDSPKKGADKPDAPLASAVKELTALVGELAKLVQGKAGT